MRSLIAILALIACSHLSAAGLKKVLILDFINVDKKKNLQYLEASLTESVTKKLKTLFAYKETERKKWERVAEDNYLFRDEWYTKSVAINLGLLAKQDIVISGHYVTKKSGGKTEVIVTTARLIDISKKKVIAEVTLDMKADSTIFDSVNQMSQKVADAAKAVLPSKEDWKRSGISDTESTPIFDQFMVGMRVGGALYYDGYAKFLDEKQPSLGLNARANLPIIAKNLALQADFLFVKHGINKDQSVPFNTLKLTGDTSNFIVGGSVLFDIALGTRFALHPKVGGGYVLQRTTVTGNFNSTENNGFPYGGGGFEFSYDLNQNLVGIFSFMTLAEIESDTITYLNVATIGINFKL